MLDWIYCVIKSKLCKPFPEMFIPVDQSCMCITDERTECSLSRSVRRIRLCPWVVTRPVLFRLCSSAVRSASAERIWVWSWDLWWWCTSHGRHRSRQHRKTQHITWSHTHYTLALKMLGVGKMFLLLKDCLSKTKTLCSPRLHLFDQKYSKIVK